MSGFLFDSPRHLFAARQMWEGARYYDAKPYRRWWGWLYMAFDEGEGDYRRNHKLPIKIGFTLQRRKRAKKLSGENWYMVWVWSVPNSQLFETGVKRVLSKFTKKNGREYASEIIYNIPADVLIQVIQLSIFETCVKKRYVRWDGDFTLEVPDVILDDAKRYVYTRPVRQIACVLNLNSKFHQLNYGRRTGPTYHDHLFEHRTKARRGGGTPAEENDESTLNMSNMPTLSISDIVSDDEGSDEEGSDEEDGDEEDSDASGYGSDEDDIDEDDSDPSAEGSGSSVVMTREKVYAVHTWVKVRYKDGKGRMFPAQVIGYEQTETELKYIVRWAEWSDGAAVLVGGKLKMSRDAPEAIPLGDVKKMTREEAEDWGEEWADYKNVKQERRIILRLSLADALSSVQKRLRF